MSQRPVAVGLLLCEQVIVEENTRNLTPVNVFSQRVAEQFPSEIPFVVFAILTDGLGEMPIDVAISRLDTLEEIYRTGTSFRFSHPLQNVRCMMRIYDCGFPVPGPYQATLFADEEMVAQRRFMIVQQENPS